METTLRIPARRYEDHDDCLQAAADDYAAAHDLAGWDLAPRWADDQRDDILLTVPVDTATGTWDIATEDGEPDDCGSDNGSLWVVSTHTLRRDGEQVATWTRCSFGHWQGSSWEVDEDTEGGDSLPDHVRTLLDRVGLTDDIPAVPEPTCDAVPEPAGKWCVYWSTVCDDAHVVERYATQDDAQQACDAANRGLHETHPGPLLCGHEVRRLGASGNWIELDDA